MKMRYFQVKLRKYSLSVNTEKLCLCIKFIFIFCCWFGLDNHCLNFSFVAGLLVYATWNLNTEPETLPSIMSARFVLQICGECVESSDPVLFFSSWFFLYSYVLFSRLCRLRDSVLSISGGRFAAPDSFAAPDFLALLALLSAIDWFVCCRLLAARSPQSIADSEAWKKEFTRMLRFFF